MRQSSNPVAGEGPYKSHTTTEVAHELIDETDLFPKTPWLRQYGCIEKQMEYGNSRIAPTQL